MPAPGSLIADRCRATNRRKHPKGRRFTPGALREGLLRPSRRGARS